MMSSLSTRRTFFAIIATLAFGLAAATAQDARQAYVPPAPGTVHAVHAEHGMVVAQEKISAQVGADILCWKYRRRRLHGDSFRRAQ
jgi:gamma-glutamyltranspeptidase/glutathione hydrolase